MKTTKPIDGILKTHKEFQFVNTATWFIFNELRSLKLPRKILKYEDMINKVPKELFTLSVEMV